MYKHILKIFKSKKNYLPPEEKDILFFDQTFLLEISKFINKRLIGFIDIRFNEINFYVVFFTLFIKFEKFLFFKLCKKLYFFIKM